MKPISAVDPARCMKCGFCMSVCPIYETDQVETHVARGRNMLIKMVAQNQHPADDAYQASLSYCLLCRRCESVCLAGLSPAEITIQARRRVVEKTRPSLPQRLIHRALISHRPLVAKLTGMASVLPGISAKEGKPMRHLVEAASLLSGNLSLPPGAWSFRAPKIPRHSQPAAPLPTKGRVAIFPGCVFEYFMPDIAKDMITAMVRAGYDVYYPRGLSCCGQAVYSKGDFKTARIMAERNMLALAEFDQVITGCATCGSALQGYPGWFDKTNPRHEQAEDLAHRSIDFTEFLTAAGFEPPLHLNDGRIVTYHDPCHMRWHLGISESPRQLLQSIQGMTYKEMHHADACCGLGGAFGLVHHHIGRRLLDKKMAAIQQSRAHIAVTACPGCLLNLKAGARRHHLPIEVAHISKLMVDSGQDTTIAKPAKDRPNKCHETTRHYL